MAGRRGIDAVSIWQDLMTHIEQHLLDEVLVFANLIQIPVVILTGGAGKPRRLSPSFIATFKRIAPWCRDLSWPISPLQVVRPHTIRDAVSVSASLKSP
jgi:hypothetical protein